jgi:hypothetical protein
MHNPCPGHEQFNSGDQSGLKQIRVEAELRIWHRRDILVPGADCLPMTQIQGGGLGCAFAFFGLLK